MSRPHGSESPVASTAEAQRLAEEAAREKNWKRWGTYLPERQWGTVREDYSADGDAWRHFPFDHAHLRAYRWGEDGLLGLTDREGRLCFCPALWNERDPIIKERLFGLSNTEGNHGEDCKELYYYLDATPTHSYSKALYKYPQTEFPYEELRSENGRRNRDEPEYEILDTQALAEDRYCDVVVEYAKAGPNDLLIQISATNRGPESAPIQLLPKLWFRNTWAWGCEHEGCTPKPSITPDGDGRLRLEHSSLGVFFLDYDAEPLPELAFAENETDTEMLYGTETYTKYTRSAFSKWILNGDDEAVRRDRGTISMLRYRFNLDPGATRSIRLRLYAEAESPEDPWQDFSQILDTRVSEANAFWAGIIDQNLSVEEQSIHRQAYAGLLWSKQFYHYSVTDWLKGDPGVAAPPESRLNGRNSKWPHLFNRDVISMPDKWEYPWYASWDLAFHLIPFARFDQTFAKRQLLLFLREWYMHPNGQIPAYEWALDDVNPPTHPWACWQVYLSEGEHGSRDVDFLKRVFSKLLLNFTWWVNRKDEKGNNIFGGGFLGLDNIGLFNRSQTLPGGATLHQADGTAWMGFYCVTMLAMALELARHDPTYDDIASKFFEHFMVIAAAINHSGKKGLWDPQSGFYYDEIEYEDGSSERVKVRSLVGLLPLIAVLSLDGEQLDALPKFRKRMYWYLANRGDITSDITYTSSPDERSSDLLLAIPNEQRLRSLLSYLFDESEFLSPYGIRSLSKYHDENPFSLRIDGELHKIHYCAGDSDTWLFGGNSNWRGPVWFPINYLIVQSLRKYHRHYGDTFVIEYPTGSGVQKTLSSCAADIECRLAKIFTKDETGMRPYNASHPKQSLDPNFGDLHQFFEYFNGDTGQGHGASHQTGWTALITCLAEERKT